MGVTYSQGELSRPGVLKAHRWMTVNSFQDETQGASLAVQW